MKKQQQFLTCRPITQADIPLLNKWAVSWGYSPYYQWDNVPPTALICSSIGVPTSSAFLLKTDGKVAYIEAIIGNPDCGKIIRRGSLAYLFEELCQEAKRAGYPVVICCSAIPSILEELNHAGFSADSKETAYMVRVL